MYIFIAVLLLLLATGLRVWRKKRIFERTNRDVEAHESYGHNVYAGAFETFLNVTSYTCFMASFILSLIALPDVLGL